MGKGSSTTTQTNQPPSEYLYGYNVALQQAQNAADQPYQNYNGQLVAGFNPTQQAAFSNISGMGNTVQPYINQAQNYFGQATQPLVSSIPTMDSGTLSGLGSSGLALNQQSTGNFGSVPTFDTSQIPSYNPQYQFNPNNIPQFSAQAVNQYQSPYTQSVVNATQAQFNNQNAQQLQQLRGNAVSAGAFGGDREAVAEGILGGQQQQAQAPVIAGLENQGYSQALGEFNTQQQSNIQAQEQAASLGQQQAATATGLGIQEQATGEQLGLSRAQALTQAQQQAAAQQFGLLQGQQQTELGANEANAWLASQAGFGSAQLGQEALNSGLSYNQALYGVGALQQQQEQEGLNVPYEQWAAQQAYPFQTTGWLANVAEGLGGSAGGTSSTTSPSSGSSLSSIAGLGTAAVGTLGATGAFGSSGWLTGSAAAGAGAVGGDALSFAPAASDAADAAFAASDAAVWRRGGRIPHRGPGGLIPDTAPVSASPMVGGSMPVSSAAPVAALSPVGMAAPASAASPAGLAAPVDSSAPVGLATPDGSGVPNASQSMVPALAASGSSGQKSSKIIQGFKDAGTTTTTQGPAFPAYMSVPAWLGDPGNNLILQNVGGPQAVDTFYRGALAAGKVAAAFFLKKGGRVSGLLPHFDDGGQVGDPGDTQGFGIVPPTDADNTPGLSPPSSVPMQQRRYHPDPWVPLMMAGFGMMAGRSRNAAENIGAGAVAGMGEYSREQREGDQAQHQQASEQMEADRLHEAVLQHRDQMGRLSANDARNANAQDQRLSLEQQRLQQQNQYQDNELDLRRQSMDMGRYAWQPGVQTDAGGNQVQGSWRMSTRGDEAPQFFPGVTQTRQLAEDRRADQGDQRIDIQRQSLAMRQDAMQRAQSTQEQAALQRMSDQAIRLYTSTRDPITGKPTITPEQAESQASQFRSSVAPAAPAAPGAPAPSGQQSGGAPAPIRFGPPLPQGMPAGSMFSPSRNMWRDPSGNLYDSGGRPVGG